MLLSKYSTCNNMKLKFLKEQEARGLLSSLAIRTPLSQIPLLDLLLFLYSQDLHIVLVEHSLKIKKE